MSIKPMVEETISVQMESELLGQPRKGVWISVVIPCYHVAPQLGEVIRQIGYEVASIICVIDGCTQGSEEVAQEAVKWDSRVRVVKHERNRGVGAAVVTGYREALRDNPDVIVKIDGDGQMDPKLISLVVAPISRGEADYVKGNRFYNLEDVREMPLLRLIGNAGLSFFSKLSSGYWNLFDPTNGFTAIHGNVAAVVIRTKINERYFFESDLLFRLNTLRAVAVDVPLVARYRDEKSNLSPIRALVQFPFLHIRNFIKRIFYCYCLRDFNAASVNLILGILLCSFGITFGLYSWSIGRSYNVLSSPGTVMLSGLPTILGWQAILSFVNFDVSNIPRRPLQRYLPHHYRSDLYPVTDIMTKDEPRKK